MLYSPYLQIVVGTTKAVSTLFPKGGIADRMIWFNGFPFLDSKEEHAFHVPVSRVMTHAPRLTLLSSTGLSLRSIETLLSSTKVQGFPVVEDRSSKILLGYIGRTELRYAIDRARKDGSLHPNAKCLFFAPASVAVRTPSAFTPPVTFDEIAESSSVQTIDFSRFVDPTPLSVHPRLPLETVMEIFKKLGPRVVLVEYKGHLAGLVTVKDCLKYQFKAETHGREGSDVGAGSLSGENEKWEIWLWGWMRRLGDGFSSLVQRCSGGRIILGSGEERGQGLLAAESVDPRDDREPILPAEGQDERPSIRRDRFQEIERDENGEGVELRERGGFG